MSAREGAGARREPLEAEVSVGGHGEEQAGGEELWIVHQRGEEGKILSCFGSQGLRVIYTGSPTFPRRPLILLPEAAL